MSEAAAEDKKLLLCYGHPCLCENYYLSLLSTTDFIWQMLEAMDSKKPKTSSSIQKSGKSKDQDLLQMCKFLQLISFYVLFAIHDINDLSGGEGFERKDFVCYNISLIS